MMFPVICEDMSRNDYLRSSYRHEQKTHQGKAEIEHILESDVIFEWIKAGAARWATEVRCAMTGYSQTFMADKGVSALTLEWGLENTLGEVWFFSGLYATETIPVKKSCLTKVWRSAEKVLIPQGARIIEAEAEGVISDKSSLLLWKKDDANKSKLGGEDGLMCVQEDSAKTPVQFLVTVSPNIWGHHKIDRSMQVAALVRAFGEMSKTPWDETPESYDPVKAAMLDKGIPPWDDEEFDPAFAATKLEPFQPQKGD